MLAKAVVVFALVAAASAGVVLDTHVGAQSEQTIRGLGFGGLSTISSQSKAVDSAFSSVRKYDTRVTNPALRVGPAVAYAAPAAYAAAPVAAAPAAYAAPAVAAPVLAKAAVPAAAPASLLGVAYSAVPQVAHLTFDGFGVHYGY